VVLHDDGDKAAIKASSGSFAGTGICIKGGYLYASSYRGVFRYKLNNNDEVIDPGHPARCSD
jgi:hypothetical protein